MEEKLYEICPAVLLVPRLSVKNHLADRQCLADTIMTLSFGKEAFWSTWHVVRIAFSLHGIWSTWYLVYMAFGLYAIWSMYIWSIYIWSTYHCGCMASGVYAIWSVRHSVYTILCTYDI
jgi:hypothetical protein